MKIIRGFKIGGLQQKIFNLMLIMILVLLGAFAAANIYQQKNLSAIVQETSAEQQASITEVSEETMEAVVNGTMMRSTALQAYIADDLFDDVKTSVLTLQQFASELFANSDSFPAHAFHESEAADDGKATVQVLHEEGVDPAQSESLALVANMSETMLAMFENSGKLDSCFVATTDGNLLYVNDRAGAYVSEDGEVYTLEVRQRFWYKQAAEAGELVFSGVELDAFTDIPGLVCAAPVYRDGELAAVVGADIFLTAISDYVRETADDSGFICVINEAGQVIFSPMEEGIFKTVTSNNAQNLKEHENSALADFVSRALKENTGLVQINIDGKDYYMCGAPMETVGWAVVSVVDKEITHQPTGVMLEKYGEINEEALASYEQGTKKAARNVLILVVVIILLALAGSLALASRTVKPLEQMTRSINSLGDSGRTFEMEDVYRTNDEIEVLARAFETLSKRARDYITQLVDITAEKERIGTELALATRIQADMLPNIFPAFPDRREFDIYAVMTPAKEVGGDFYDFFLIDDQHLGIVMADVSGKGVPAALFMMVSKILVQNYAMTGLSPAQVLQAVNRQICSNNREEMFVTVWFGIMDTSTGRIIAANAGHEYPVLMNGGGQFELLKDKHGFVIGGMDTAQYREYELTLTEGSKLFLYTDGVPEATNADNAMFGIDRMIETLNKEPGAAPEKILSNVAQAVDAWVLEADRFDDLTMLCVEYKGEGGNG